MSGKLRPPPGLTSQTESDLEDDDGPLRSLNNDLEDALNDIADNENEEEEVKESEEVIQDDFLNPTHCFICTEPIQFHALGVCNHRVCHICSLRLRALYKSKSCAYCKRELTKVLYTTDSSKPYTQFRNKDLPFEDKRLGIKFDSTESYEDTMILLRFNCPEPTCDVVCNTGWKELKKHVKEVHNLILCDICVKNKRVFAHEQSLYTQAQLNKHHRGTLGQPLDEPNFKGHPECGFCKTRFYSDDELYEHCRMKHEECHVCTRMGIRHQYFFDYAQMEEHWKKDHFPCLHPSCLEKKFVVFASDLDLKAHQLSEHGNKSKVTYQPVDIGFRYSRQGQRLDRPTSPLRQEDRAADAIRNQLRPPPSFGSQLSQPSSTTSQAVTNNPTPPTPTDPNSIPGRLQVVFNHDANKFAQFKSLAQSFKSSLISADEFINLMIQLATEGENDEGKRKEKEQEVGKIWIRMAETVPEQSSAFVNAVAGGKPKLGKKEEMLRAWKDYQVKTTEYPSLQPKTNMNWAKGKQNHGGARVLVIKSNATKHKPVTKPNSPSLFEKIAQEVVQRNQEEEDKVRAVSQAQFQELKKEPVVHQVNKPVKKADFPSLPKQEKPVGQTGQTWVTKPDPEPEEEVKESGKKKKKQVLFRYG